MKRLNRGAALWTERGAPRAPHGVFATLTGRLRPATDCATSPPYAEFHRGLSESRWAGMRARSLDERTEVTP
jgi:hypothetical protein